MKDSLRDSLVGLFSRGGANDGSTLRPGLPQVPSCENQRWRGHGPADLLLVGRGMGLWDSKRASESTETQESYKGMRQFLCCVSKKAFLGGFTS